MTSDATTNIHWYLVLAPLAFLQKS